MTKTSPQRRPISRLVNDEVVHMMTAAMEDSDDPGHFADVIRRLRQEAGLSQAGLAAAAGVHQRQINRYESGEQQPALNVSHRLAFALGVTLVDLAGVLIERVKLHFS